MKLANNLKRCRFNHNSMSQAELAQLVDVTRQTIISIEKGKFIPSTYLALRIAKVFDLRVEDIFILE